MYIVARLQVVLRYPPQRTTVLTAGCTYSTYLLSLKDFGDSPALAYGIASCRFQSIPPDSEFPGTDFPSQVLEQSGRVVKGPASSGTNPRQ